ncbi:MAG: hypothetical protein U0641_12695 [Anaerolineae bacterium]
MIEPSRQAVTNPYLGPRTFTYADREFFFGREREAHHLLARIAATRMMLFYAPSGAGKSSLLNTCIIPGLRDEPYNRAVLPIGRVSGESPASLGHVDNSDVFNLLASLDQGASDPIRLAHLTLKDFLAGFGSDDGLDWRYDPSRTATAPAWAASPYPYVLVIDQFEDIIAGYPGLSGERDNFFSQLADALQADARLSVTLAFRVEYLGAIDPYIRRMSDWLIGRFYMDRLSMDAALEAVKRPAQAAGRPFAPGVAETLVEDLSRAHAGQAEAGGEYVEPMHLQAVCYRLWQSLAPLPRRATGAHQFRRPEECGRCGHRSDVRLRHGRAARGPDAWAERDGAGSTHLVCDASHRA